ncbi:uncharacterized protein ZBAI_02958 [Zygosaccharomyces bailii ISA1307]|nr:uncharacterized protein ZBAI_02958 [Zygosaccharomyces bailii ISA1307]
MCHSFPTFEIRYLFGETDPDQGATVLSRYRYHHRILAAELKILVTPNTTAQPPPSTGLPPKRVAAALSPPAAGLHPYQNAWHQATMTCQIPFNSLLFSF